MGKWLSVYRRPKRASQREPRLLGWPLRSQAAKCMMPVEPEIIMEIPAYTTHKIPNPKKGILLCVTVY